MTIGAEIANAYVALTVKMPGVKGDIERALGGSDARGAAERGGSLIGSTVAGAVGGAVAAVTGKAISAVMGSIDGAIKRVDTLNSFPKIMKNLGYSSDDAQKSIAKMSDKLAGLPTSLDQMAGVTQQLAPLTGGLDQATNLSLALNNALLAGGKSTVIQANAMDQYVQMLAVGKVDMAAWRSLQTAMPGQLDQIAKSMLGATANSSDLYAAMQSGGVTFDQFNQAILDLDKNGLAGYASFAAQAKDATTGIGTAQENLTTAITRGLGNLIQKFQPQITGLLTGVTQAVNDGFKGLTGAVDWVNQNKDWLAPLALGIGVVTAGFTAMGAASAVAAAGGLTKWLLATKAGAAAQAAFNLVMNANPIMLIVTAIGALVAGLVYFFTQTETGKKIWAEFSRFLGEAWANISAAAQWAWENVLKPVFEGIGAVVTWIYQNVISPIFTLIVNYFRFWGAVAVWLWENAISPAFAAIGAVFNWIWSTIIQPIVGLIALEIQGLGVIFGWLYENAIRPAWEGIQAAIGAVWSWLDQNVFPVLRTAIDLVGQAFANTAKSIGVAWDGIKKAAAIPINFILDVVWNNGLRSFWNDMVDGLGLSDMKLPKANLIQFASGGVLPGYTPGRDVHQFWSPTAGGLALSGGEAIMRPEFTRAVGGPAGVARLNAMARSGMLAFKDGGVLGEFGNFASDVIDNLRKAGDFVSGMIMDPIGTVQRTVIDGLLRPLLGGAGDNIFARTVGQLPINLMQQMAKLFQSKGVGQGTEGMGWEAMWALVQRFIPGATLNDALRPAGTQTATGSLSYHSLGRAIDIGPATMDTFNAALRLFPNARELIFSPAGDRQLYNGQPYFWTGINRDMHWDHVHIAMANGGVVPEMGKAKLYDQGGWLPHGGVAVNRSGRPEAVLDPEQSAALRRRGETNITVQALPGMTPQEQAELIVRELRWNR
ncbi:MULTISPECIES: tape measure protein [unclassified Microbacterium]|uniref:tape measure protein n=1 Tax=unclassified Microbacterium TaxID=2609290 RepID=UPI003017BEBC